MSSLAGALEPSQAYIEVKPEKHEALDSPAADLFGYDAEMQPKSEGDTKRDDDEQDEPMEDLFGEDAEVTGARDESATSPTPSGHISDGLSSDERRRRQELEYGEEDEPQQPEYEQVLEATVQIPNIPVPKSSDGNYWVIRMPNFVQVDSKPFHHETYVGPEDDDAPQAESLREKSMTIKLKVENTVRWRWVKDENGQYRKQSNSRVIRWSDGSLSLLLGKELFDITQTIDTSGTVPRQSISGSQPGQSSQHVSQPTQPATPGPKSQGLTYLVAQHKRAFILQSEAVVTGYMSLRPTGMQSETHRMLVRAVGQKHNRVARLRMAPDPTMDPEREKMELLKLQSKKPKKTRIFDEDGFGGSRRRRGGVSRKRSGDMMWSDEDDEEGIFEASDDEDGAMGSPRRSQKKAAPADQRKGTGDYQPDDFLVEDSEEEGYAGSDDGVHRRKRRRGRDDEEAEEDDLEKMEAKIEEDERKRRRQEPGGITSNVEVAEEAEAGGGDEAMDVESEEEDEEFKVRRAGTGSRKKRVMADFDEDEDE
ncbi:Leo1-domain-containing protein [Neolentinus lepideus HHB14362 ss-1]|uniref:Leo1-domain-containing protein n=1 Tax=Neolentinus lepideus HHB14362 ss-1 TaxID=1314782 RepID=A0A165U9P5_9AGAM|nr:Leo1-domain-containing protein [Neolentinus lepideus HHB14362 ss-1]